MEVKSAPEAVAAAAVESLPNLAPAQRVAPVPKDTVMSAGA